RACWPRSRRWSTTRSWTASPTSATRATATASAWSSSSSGTPTPAWCATTSSRRPSCRRPSRATTWRWAPRGSSPTGTRCARPCWSSSTSVSRRCASGPPSTWARSKPDSTCWRGCCPLGRIDDIIDLMRKSKDTASARKKLMGKEYGLTEVQANAILGLTLSRLTGMEEKKLKSEQKDLASKNKELTQLMEDDSKVKAVMVEEMLALKNKYAVPRRSIIIKDEGELSAESLIENLQSIIMITHSGYIKRM
ncbi:unnamed protein product, partial [Heterosigma akashiwo]